MSPDTDDKIYMLEQMTQGVEETRDSAEPILTS